MIDRMATRLATTIKETNPQNTSSVEVMKFSLIIILNALATALLTLSVGLVTGAFVETLIVLIGFAVLRFFSGGMHLSSSAWCTIVSTAVLAIIPHIPTANYTVLFTVVSLIMVVLFAPSDVEKHNRLAQRKALWFKAVASLIVASNFLWGSDTLAKVFIVQALLLIPIKRR